MRKAMLAIVLAMPVWMSACSYPKERWKAFTEDIKRQAAQPRTQEGKCQVRGGVLYNGQCYTPTDSPFDEETCHMRGGLYLDEKCLVAPQGRPTSLSATN
jgi:hypothetical protein